jgi:predicted nucleotidyltransferase
MDAAPQLRRIAAALHACGLEAVLIGNAAAALHGAPVTTLDFDFLFRVTASNVKKLKAFADTLGATILRPYYPASSLYRVVDDDTGLQVDFMTAIHGVRSLASLRARAATLDVGGFPLLVASLDDIIRSKRAAGRPRDTAVLPVLETTRAETQAKTHRSKS